MDPFVEVYVASSVPDAYVIKAALEAQGITVQIANEHLESAMGGVPFVAPQVLVPRSELEHAMQVLRDIEAGACGADSQEDWQDESASQDEGPEGHVD